MGWICEQVNLQHHAKLIPKHPPSPFPMLETGKTFPPSAETKQKKNYFLAKRDFRSGVSSIGPGGGGGFWNYVLRGDVRLFLHTCRLIHTLKLPTCASTLDVCSSGVDRYSPPRVLDVHSSQVGPGVGGQLSPRIPPNLNGPIDWTVNGWPMHESIDHRCMGPLTDRSVGPVIGSMQIPFTPQRPAVHIYIEFIAWFVLSIYIAGH